MEGKTLQKKKPVESNEIAENRTINQANSHLICK